MDTKFEKIKCPNPNNNPNCKNIIIWNKGKLCRSCSKLKENNPMFGRKGKLNPNYCRANFKKGKTYESLYGQKKAEEIKSKQSKNNYAKTPEGRELHRKRMILYNKENNLSKHPETRKKMRLAAINRIEQNKLNGNQLTPGYNPQGCEIINWFNMYYDFNFQHAENGGEICVHGYFPDGLDKTVIIETDEKHPYDGDGNLKQKDIDRQQYLENKGYEFIRVRV